MEPTELNEKPKFNWKRLLITVGIVIITAGAIGGSVYYVMNQQATKDKESAEKTAQDLQKQIDDLKKTTTSTSTTTTTPSTTDVTANWESYSDSKYNYLIKYPSTYTHTGGDVTSGGKTWNEQSFLDKKYVNSSSAEPKVKVFVNNSNGKSVLDWYRTEHSGSYNEGIIPTTSKLNGIDAYLVNNKTNNVTDYYILRGNYIYTVSNFNYNDDSTLNTILSTFRFTN